MKNKIYCIPQKDESILRLCENNIDQNENKITNHFSKLLHCS